MSFVDREIVCLDCTQPFVFTAGEQEFYERKGFKEEPKRCKPCREVRKQRRSDTPVTPRAPRAAGTGTGAGTGTNGNGAGAAGFGFRGGGDDDAASELEPGNQLSNEHFPEEGDEEDNIGNRMPGLGGAPARPRAAAPRGPNGGMRERPAGARERGGGERGGGERGGGGADRREMHDATCAQCSGVARVPFKPVPGRPVYCRDCYASRAASAGGR